MDAPSHEPPVTPAESVLSALDEVYAFDDIQQIVDHVCLRVVQHFPWRRALLSLYFGEDVYLGLEGGDEALRGRFLTLARATTEEERRSRREMIWTKHRIDGTNICFIPAESDVPLGRSFAPCEARPGAEWQPNDRLMVYVRGADKEIYGVFALDRPVDGKRPDPNDLGTLRIIDKFVTLMGVVIHNKHLAQKLRESEERYAAVVEQGHDGILIVRDGHILFVNRRFGELYGEMPIELVGQTLKSVIAQDEGATLPGEKEGRLLRADGRVVDVALRTSTIRFGGSTATLIAVADITERKRILAQLVRTQKMDTIATLASGVAHDFNNVLGGIIGYASLLKTSIDDPERALRYVNAIEKAADRAADVTRQLLGIVRDEEARVAPFPVARVLGEVAHLLEETLDPSISVVIRCAPDLPHVLGDESQIHQVLLNIALNAKDAMKGGGTLALEASPASNDGAWPTVRIGVSDTGEGMDAETMEKVFDPFFTTKTGGAGTGLGLYMAYRVIERHGGTIDISSARGKGTTIEILLPASAAATEIETQRLVNDGQTRSGVVLLVDDEALMRDVGAEMLGRLGYQVVLAEHGQEGIDKVRDHGDDFCCVVLDIAMPVKNGWDAAREIRLLRPDLPILFSSGNDVDAARGHTHGIDAARCLKKPYNLGDLRHALDDVMKARA